MTWGTVSKLAALNVLFASAVAFGEIPEPDIPDYKLADDLTYGSVKAREHWKPMAGSKNVAVIEVGGGSVLKLPCNFRGTKIERSSWDRKINLDLAYCRGIQFHFFCSDPSPVSRFTFYLRSGEGWYARNFYPESRGEWDTIVIKKNRFQIEGSPGGWGKIDGIRVSAWRGKAQDTTFYLANIGLFGADAPVCVLQENSTLKQRSDTVERILENSSLPFCVLSESDFKAHHLENAEIVILAHGFDVTDNVTDALVRFIEVGGKIVSFVSLSERLAELMGIKYGPMIREKVPGNFSSIRPAGDGLKELPKVMKAHTPSIRMIGPENNRSRVAADWYDGTGRNTGYPAIVVAPNAVCFTNNPLQGEGEEVQRMLLAAMGHLTPELLRQAALARIKRIAVFGPFKGFNDVSSEIERLSRGDPDLVRLTTEAFGHCNGSTECFAIKKYAAAILRAQKAHGLYVRAWCLAQQPIPNEHRAFWCHSAFGVEGMEWEEAIRTLADNGFTAILPNMLWGGVAFYPSEVLPTHSDVEKRGDQIALCLAACKKHGVECHVWKVNWNMGWRTPKEFMESMKKAGRTQVQFNGKPMDRWLCPTHPENQRLEIDSMVEVVANYDVAGIHFDYIRYPGKENCFCSCCLAAFEKTLGRKIPSWPGDVFKDDELKEPWFAFRRNNITTVVAAVAKSAREIRPGIKISAAVFTQPSLDRDIIGQDWGLWCDEGYLDFVCPMDYTHENDHFRSLVENQIRIAGKVRCYPGIGLSVWPERGDLVKLIEQINITRRYETGGFTVFNYGTVEANEVLPLCGQGITRRRE